MSCYFKLVLLYLHSVTKCRTFLSDVEHSLSRRAVGCFGLPDPFLMRSRRVLSIFRTFFASDSSSSHLTAPRRPSRDRQNHSETTAKPNIFYRKPYYNWDSTHFWKHIWTLKVAYLAEKWKFFNTKCFSWKVWSSSTKQSLGCFLMRWRILCEKQ